jgi:putative ABC transport system permease protein
MDTLRMDVRLAVRALAARPGFTLAAVLTLALGIGGSTAIFGFVDAVLLRPLPYDDPGRLVSVANVIPQLRAEMAGGGDYLDWRDRSRSLAAIAAYSSSDSVTLVSGGEPRRVPAAHVSASFLPTLGIVPAAGRNFRAEEDRPRASGVAVVTAKLWHRLFPDAAPGEERSVELDGSLRAVVGVLPDGFVFPGQPEVELLLPLALDEPGERARARQSLVKVIGRLGPDATIEQARAELAAIQSAAVAAAPAAPRRGFMITGSAPDVRGPGPTGDAPAPPPSANAKARRPYGFDTYLKVVPLQRALAADLRPALLLFSAAVGLVMMMACANTANLLLARAAARQGEMAVRAALGAGRGRLVRQLLTESAVLALLGGAAGLAVAALLIAAVLALVPPEIAASFRRAAVRVDTGAIAFTLLLSLGTSALFGLVPALFAARVDAGEGLRAGARCASPGAGRRRVRRLLVGAEVAVAFVLLVGAGLLVRSFVRLTALDPGFRPGQVVTVALELKRQDYPAPAAQLTFFERLLERARTLPGVEAAAAGDSLPLKPFSMVMMGGGAADQPLPEPGRSPELALCAVTPDYFRALGIVLRGGRPFLDSDRAGSPEVAIVNETLARRLWGAADPVGKQMRFPRAGSPELTTVVGVVADVRHEGLETAPRGVVYRPFAQDPRPFAFVALRAPVDPSSLVAALRREVAALDRGLAVHDVATMDRRLSDATAARRFNTALVGAFGLVALLLSAVGLYGVMAQSVTERTRELGIRIAIGAAPRQVRALVLRQGLAMAAGGAAVGAVASLIASRALKGALYGVGPTDQATFAAVPVILLAVCAIACALPARRATRVDPAVALRAE